MKKYVLIIMIFLTILSCDKKMKQLKELSKKEDIELLILGEDSGNEVMEGLSNKIKKTIKLNVEQRKKLLNSLLDSQNYSPAVTRKCKFEAVYALRIDGKIYATFDVEFCPLLEKFNSEKNEFIQIKTENSIKKVITEILKE